MQFISHLNQRFGAAIQREVLREATEGHSVTQQRVSAVTTAMATVIHLTPALLGALALWLMAAGWDSWPVIGLATLLLGAAIYLYPRRIRNTRPTLRRAKAPALFALFDALTGALKAPPITGVHIDDRVNASIISYPGDDHVITLGAPLWLALEPDERLAVLAHEVAHLVNEDPTRAHVTGAAMVTMSRWHDLFEPPALIDHESNTAIIIDDRTLGGQIVSGLFGGLVRAIAFTFEKLVFAESQRAEYRADILAAATAGAPALARALNKLILAPLAQTVLSNTYYDGSKPVPVFEQMANAMRQPAPEAATQLVKDAAASLHTVDGSHPPTRFRQEVLNALSGLPTALTPDSFDWSEIDAELAEEFEKSENSILNQTLAQ